MTLEEMIHTYWRDSVTLCAAIPVDRFYTAAATLPGLPCVVLLCEKTSVLFHSNRSGPWENTSLSFTIHHHSYEQGATVARLVEEAFDRLRLHDTERARSYLFRLTQSENAPNNEQSWKCVRKFHVIG